MPAAPKPPPSGGPLRVQRWQIPQEMRNHHGWACWRYEQEHGRWSKPPYNPRTGERAEGGDSETWSEFDTCYQAYSDRERPKDGGRSYDGVSFALNLRWGIVGIDLDHVSDHGRDAKRIVDLLDSYTEISPSGDGVHVFVKATLPEGRRRRDWVELYSRRRFLSVTGQHVDGMPERVAARPLRLFTVWDEYVQHELARRA